MTLTPEERWAKRDLQREADQHYYAQQTLAETERLTKIGADALVAKARLKAGGECVKYARIVVQALRDSGVVFASMGPCCERHHPELNDGCQHTEHAIRAGVGRVGRYFEKYDSVGTWEPCPEHNDGDDSERSNSKAVPLDLAAEDSTIVGAEHDDGTPPAAAEEPEIPHHLLDRSNERLRRLKGPKLNDGEIK